MSKDTAKAMQDALNAAVSRMRSGEAASATSSAASAAPGSIPELIGGLMSILPKMLQNDEASEEFMEKLGEKLDGLKKGELTELREGLLVLRKQCHRLIQGQEEIWQVIHEIRKQQHAAHQAIAQHLEMITQHLARMSVIDNVPLDDDVSGEAPSLPGGQPRSGANNYQRKVRQKTAKDSNRTRS